MLKPDEWICPKCGKVCDSLTVYLRHAEREHKERMVAR